MIPHVTHQLWRELGHEQALALERWWTPDADALVQDEIEISVQVGGKMRARVRIPADGSQEVAIAAALADANVKKFVEDKPIKFAKYVPGKLVNIVV
jgi:leucyl-tRNA synthetase